MMMTAAGTVPPARVFVIGAGVAGLQAIATARRLGAIVSATDVRPAAKEEIRSLGATYVGVDDEETAGQTGAYAKEMTDAFRQKQAELMATTVAKNDLVICTALVMGRKAPVIITQPMVASMKAGSVIVDLASDAGGNCAATKPGEAITTANGVRVLGFSNWPGRIAVASSSLYSRNLLTFLTTFWDKEAKAPKLPADDEIVQGVMLTRGGAVVHPQFAARPVRPAAVPSAGSASIDRMTPERDAAGGRRAARDRAACDRRPTHAAARSGLTPETAMNPTQLADEAARLAEHARASPPGPVSPRSPWRRAARGGAVRLSFAVFLMACFVGYYVVWNVTPALHSPLMAVTNAISFGHHRGRHARDRPRP